MPVTVTWRIESWIELTAGETTVVHVDHRLCCNTTDPYAGCRADTDTATGKTSSNNYDVVLRRRDRFDRVTAAIELLINDIQMDDGARANPISSYVPDPQTRRSVRCRRRSFRCSLQRADHYLPAQGFQQEVYRRAASRFAQPQRRTTFNFVSAESSGRGASGGRDPAGGARGLQQDL